MFPHNWQEVVSTEDANRAAVASIAVRLHKFPHEVLAQPARDIWDIVGILEEEAIRNQPKG